ncbi:unnamed protein product [Rhizophagus irregularis]|nr:unnamed protein product [Rhizophagus irregularis]
MIAIKENVLCICRGCLYETNNSGKYVSIATRTRHRRRDKKFKNNYIPPNIPLHNIDITTPSRVESTNISEDNDQNDSPEIMEVSSNSESTSIINDNNQNEPINENTLYSSSSEEENNEVEDNEEDEDNNEEYDSDNNEGYDNNSNEEYDNEECDDHYDEEYIDDEEYDTNGEFDDNDEEYDSDQEEDNSGSIPKEFYLSDNLIKGLQLLYVKEKHTLSNEAFNEIMRIFAKHIYFPLQPPRGYDGTNYDPNNLPMRSHASYLQDIEAVENRGRVRNRIMHERGKL